MSNKIKIMVQYKDNLSYLVNCTFKIAYFEMWAGLNTGRERLCIAHFYEHMFKEK